ncbi:MAG: archease [Candidatus Omnitrophica bacterium]|nr:archease [Candidatus Omnitrophota bacterium]MDD5352853.1 archease [Candidatus Omnitrophota bacterium]MDD5550452.1 archease [Candidatus Omnitrophota bacterium]
MKKFETFEHTADIGLKIYAKDSKELFINAAKGLFSLITDLNKVQASDKISVNLEDDNREELLISWLNELIFQFSARNFIPKEFKINKISDKELNAEVHGENLDSAKHKILSEVKAATYHELEIKETQDGLEARIIFDT